MSKPKILLQLDSDEHASVFDAVVAVDAGVDHLLQYHSVEPTQVQDLVHGAIFTRSPKNLTSTAIFIGGTDMSSGEAIMRQVKSSFVGPMKVSAMLDCNGSNSTAAAAVLAIERHFELASQTVVVLAATGPVGQRIVRLLARAGADVRVGSRSESRAAAVCEGICEQYPDAKLTPVGALSADDTARALAGASVVVAAGARGVNLLRKEELASAAELKLAIDLNAVPPAGIETVEATDRGEDRNGVLCYGALGVGGDKMKIHKAALNRLFESNDQLLDAEEIFDLGRDSIAE